MASANGWSKGGFWEWCAQCPLLGWPASSKKLSMSESETVQNSDKLRRARIFKVDSAVASSGEITMLAHLTISEGGGNLASRIYFHDDTSDPGRFTSGSSDLTTSFRTSRPTDRTSPRSARGRGRRFLGRAAGVDGQSPMRCWATQHKGTLKQLLVDALAPTSPTPANETADDLSVLYDGASLRIASARSRAIRRRRTLEILLDLVGMHTSADSS